jgi:hypothetical protein
MSIPTIEEVLSIVRPQTRSKTVYVVTPDATVRAREVMLISAVLDAIAFAEAVRDAKAGYWDEDGIKSHIEGLRFALPTQAEPQSGVLADLQDGREG